MPPPYSAGSVFLQVVPSFAGVQEEIGRRAREYGKLFGKEFDEGFAEETKDGLGKSVDEGMKRSRDRARSGGQEAGKAYSDGFGREAGKGTEREIGKALDRTSRSSEKAGQAAGSKYGGKFAESIKKALASAQREIDAIKVDADADPALAAIGEIRAAMASLRDAKIGVDLDAADAVASISVLESLLDIIQQNAESIQVRVDADQAMAHLSAVRTMVEQLNRDDVDIEVKADPKLGSFESTMKAKIASALDDLPPVDLQADDSDINQKIAAIRTELFALSDAKLNVDVSTDEAMTRLRTLMAELAALGTEDADIGVRVDAAAAEGHLAKIFALVTALEANDVDIDVDVDAERATNSLRRLRSQVTGTGIDGQSSANAFRAFNTVVLAAVTLGPALVPILGAIGGGLLALGPAAAVGVGALGVVALAFSGIKDAVTAYGNVDKNAAKDATAAAKTMRSAYNGIRDARLALSRALQSQDDAAVDSARRVADAVRAQEAAEKRLTDAQAKSKKATEDLSKARKDAAEQIQDLALRAKDAGYAERQAQIDLAKAKATLIATNQDGSATKVEREEADIAAGRAQDAYDASVLDNQRLSAQKTETDKTGVEGTDTYKAAAEQVASANDAVKDASTGVEDATRDVAEAQDASARSQRDALQSVQDAQQRLIDAQVSYQEALQDTQTIGSSAAQQLKDALAKLSPAGQAFALYLYGLRGQLKQLRDAAQEGLLPGVQSGIESFLGSTGGKLLTFVTVVSGAFGDLAKRAGEAFGNPAWQAFFDMMNTYAPIFISQWGTIFGNLIEGFRNVLMALFPFTKDMGDGLIGLTQKWADWTAGFSDPNSGFQHFLTWVRENGPIILGFFLDLVDAGVNIVKALAPFGKLVLGAIDGIAKLIGWMNPKVLGAIVIAVLAIVAAFQIFSGVIALVAAIFTILEFSVIAAVVGGIILFIAAIVILWTQSETFRKIVIGAWDAIKAAVTATADWFMKYVWPTIKQVWANIIAGAEYMWQQLQPVFEVLGNIFSDIWDGLQWAWENVGKKVFDMFISVVQTLWTSVVEPIFGLIMAIFEALWALWKLQWETIGKPVFDAFWKLVQWVWDYVVKPVFDAIGVAFSALATVFSTVWYQYMKPIFDAFGTVIDGLTELFQGNVDGIKTIWEGLVDIFKTPIKFLIETVINKGLIGGINKLAGVFMDNDQWIKPLDTAWLDDKLTGSTAGASSTRAGTAYATGGSIAGSSPTDTADNIPIWATAGEFMQPVSTVDYYGTGIMEALRRRAIPREAFSSIGLATGGSVPGGPTYKSTDHDESWWKKALDFIKHPLDGVKNLVTAAAGNLTDTPIGQLLVNVPIKLAEKAVSKLLSFGGSDGGSGSGTPSASGALSGDRGANKAIFQSVAAQHGWGSGAQWSALDRLEMGEAGYNNTAQNPTSTAYGFGQFLNSTWAGVGGSKTSDPALQAEYMMRYIERSYGDPVNAFATWSSRNPHWYAQGGLIGASTGLFAGLNFGDLGLDLPASSGTLPVSLYDDGGYLPPGLTMVMNATGAPEPVLTADELQGLQDGATHQGGGGDVWDIDINETGDPDRAVAKLMHEVRVVRRSGKYARSGRP